jgi:hypothetical protein
MRRSAGLAGATAILALTTSLLWPATAGARTAHSLVVVSDTNGTWVNHFGTRTGTAVLTYGNTGCHEADANGFCKSGVWPRIPGAHWVSNRRNVTKRHAQIGTRSMNFMWTFSLPAEATNIAGKVRITVDDAYRLFLNGTPIGHDGVLKRKAPNGGLSSIERYNITPVAGVNTIVIRTVNDRFTGDGTPYVNPAGIIFRADISYEE